MDTKFTKFDKNYPGWSIPFHVGTEWLQIFEILSIEMKKEQGIVLFWSYPHILYFSLELFVKSLAKHEDSNFNAKKDGFGHSATAIIAKYKSIPIFLEIIQNNKLFNLIKEYEKTLDTRFGDTSVQMDGSDTELILQTVYKIREEMCRRTKLR